MAVDIWKIDDECAPNYFVELRGLDHELTEVKSWAVERYGDRVAPYIRNRASKICGDKRPVFLPEMLYTTIVFYDVKDLIHFKLTWG